MIICTLVSLVQHYVCESMLLHVTAVHFLLLCSILLYDITTIYEFILVLMEIWVVSSLWLL